MKVLKLISSIMYLALTQRLLESETATNTEQTAFKLIAVAHFIFIGYVIFEPILKKNQQIIRNLKTFLLPC